MKLVRIVCAAQFELPSGDSHMVRLSVIGASRVPAHRALQWVTLMVRSDNRTSRQSKAKTSLVRSPAKPPLAEQGRESRVTQTRNPAPLGPTD